MWDIFPLPLVLLGADLRDQDLDLLTATGVSNASLPPALFLFLLLDDGDVSESSTVSVTFPCSTLVDGDTRLDTEELLLLSGGDFLDTVDASLLR